MQRTTLSVGPALRKVREGRGLTLEEAARDTRVRLEFLEAIESEDFHLLLGDVHLRGCLRTYATYLRLSPDKVVAVYQSDRAPHDEVIVVPPPARTEPVLGGRRRRDDHRLWILVAATVLVLATAFGVLSARRPAPAPANLSAETGTSVSAAEVGRPVPSRSRSSPTAATPRRSSSRPMRDARSTPADRSRSGCPRARPRGSP